jgi:hypothetical protein
MSIDANRKHAGIARALPLLATILGVALVVLAVPRVMAHATLLPFGDVRSGLVTGRHILAHRLDEARSAFLTAAAWAPGEPSFWREQALIARRLARSDGASGDKRDYLLNEEALAAARHYVRLSPGDGYAWALFAQTRIDADARPADVVQELRLARLTAPSRASVSLVHFRIAMLHWKDTPDEIREISMRDVLAYWRYRPLRPLLVSTYLEADYAARAAFREALGADPRALKRFDRLLISG